VVKRGFSILEMIAALVILLVVSIGVVTVYVQVRNQGYERLGRARLETVLQAEYARVVSGGVFSDEPADLRALTSDVSLTTGASFDPATVSIALGEDGSLGLAVALPNDDCLLAGVSSPTAGLTVLYPAYPDDAPCHGALGLPDGSAYLAP
jgi:prepilin-type N-terminal cleavage/methylation domain-containing protein